MSGTWREYGIAGDASHHVHLGRPAYAARFTEVLKFHAPGLAPVRDDSGAYHITPDGRPAYESRHVRTFGFYEDRAAVRGADGWFHMLPDGRPLYRERYAWCGNFQEGRCPVRDRDGGYFHVTADGGPAYDQRYRYAGDFKDGCAVVLGSDGRHTHIDGSGNLLHRRWFLDLDVFHKSYARARDAGGWHHADTRGESLYEERFQHVEPFYNGQARVEGFDGSLSVIDESGKTLVELRKPLRSPLEELSADMVGMWRTQTVRAAVEMGVFEVLPTSAEEVERRLHLGQAVGARLMRALTELGLVRQDRGGAYRPTGKGEHLRRSHPLSLADAALHWGNETYTAWAGLDRSLRTGASSFTELYGASFFHWLQDRPEERKAYNAAMAAYARHDYRALADAVDFGVHNAVLDAGGGLGELTFALLRAYPGLTGTVMDRSEVIADAVAPVDIGARCRFVPGDLFLEWPVRCDAVALARVLHDWPDDTALHILRRAREAMPKGGTLYVVEVALDESSGDGGLLDLHMLVTTGGRERTERQFADLLAAAGFELLDVTPTASVSSVIRARAA